MDDFFIIDEPDENVTPSFEDNLKLLTQGLLYPSESDYELSYISFESDIPSPINLIAFRQFTGNLPKTFAKSFDYNLFFENILTEKDWWTDFEKARAFGFQKLKTFLETELQNLEFIKIGKIEIQAYLIGKDKTGFWKGVKTTIIET